MAYSCSRYEQQAVIHAFAFSPDSPRVGDTENNLHFNYSGSKVAGALAG